MSIPNSAPGCTENSLSTRQVYSECFWTAASTWISRWRHSASRFFAPVKWNLTGSYMSWQREPLISTIVTKNEELNEWNYITKANEHFIFKKVTCAHSATLQKSLWNIHTVITLLAECVYSVECPQCGAQFVESYTLVFAGITVRNLSHTHQRYISRLRSRFLWRRGKTDVSSNLCFR